VKKVAGKNKDHRNRTAHQLAMADAKVRKALSMLQSNWNSLSPQERNERLNNLAELNCSARGIAEETGIPLTTIRRYINLANPSKSRIDSKAEMKRTFANVPKKRSVTTSIKAAVESRNMFLKNKATAPAVKEPDPPNEPQHHSKVEPAEKIANPASIVTKAPTLVDNVLGRQESRAEEDRTEMSPLERYHRANLDRLEKMQWLASLSDSIPPRPVRDARSMKRQGRPLQTVPDPS
jgi:hypothetical protein